MSADGQNVDMDLQNNRLSSTNPREHRRGMEMMFNEVQEDIKFVANATKNVKYTAEQLFLKTDSEIKALNAKVDALQHSVGELEVNIGKTLTQFADSFSNRFASIENAIGDKLRGHAVEIAQHVKNEAGVSIHDELERRDKDLKAEWEQKIAEFNDSKAGNSSSSSSKCNPSEENIPLDDEKDPFNQEVFSADFFDSYQKKREQLRFDIGKEEFEFKTSKSGLDTNTFKPSRFWSAFVALFYRSHRAFAALRGSLTRASRARKSDACQSCEEV